MAESLPAGSGDDWLCWRALNRLRTEVGRAKTVMRSCMKDTTEEEELVLPVTECG